MASLVRCVLQKGMLAPAFRTAVVTRTPAAITVMPPRRFCETATFIRGTSVHQPTQADKLMLVKANMYPTIADVPDIVPISQLRKAHEYMRIRLTSWLISLFVGGFIGMIGYQKYMHNADMKRQFVPAKPRFYEIE